MLDRYKVSLLGKKYIFGKHANTLQIGRGLGTFLISSACVFSLDPVKTEARLKCVSQGIDM